MSIASRIASIFVTSDSPSAVATAISEQRSLSIEEQKNGLLNAMMDEAFGESSGLSTSKVSEATAMRLGAVAACVKIPAEDLSGRDVIIERRENGKWIRDDDHRLNRLFQDPGPYSWTAIVESTTGNAGLSGNGIAPLRRNKRTGIVEAIEIRDYTEVSIYETIQRDRIWYHVIDSEGRPQVLRDDEVIHIKAFSLYGKVGISPIAQVANSVAMSLNALDYANKGYANGGFGGGFITTEDEMNGQSRLKYARQVKQAQALGLHPVLDRGMKIEPNKISPKDIEFINTMSYGREDIAAINRVPLFMISDTKAPGTNLEQQSLNYVKFCLLPWARRWEEELERKLLLASERLSYRIKFDFSSLLRGDSASMANFYSQMLTMQVLLPNEVREVLGYDERPDGGGNMPIDHQKAAAAQATPGGPNIHTTSSTSEDIPDEQ